MSQTLTKSELERGIMDQALIFYVTYDSDKRKFFLNRTIYGPEKMARNQIKSLNDETRFAKAAEIPVLSSGVLVIRGGRLTQPQSVEARKLFSLLGKVESLSSLYKFTDQHSIKVEGEILHLVRHIKNAHRNNTQPKPR